MNEPVATCTPEVAQMIDPSGALQKAGLLTVKPHAWKVIINGKDSGIVETNFQTAAPYWSHRALITGRIIRLIEV
jgi:hypothetical protein